MQTSEDRYSKHLRRVNLVQLLIQKSWVQASRRIRELRTISANGEHSSPHLTQPRQPEPLPPAAPPA